MAERTRATADAVLRRGVPARNGVIWALAAVLGAMSLGAAATIIHDDSQRRESVVVVVRAAAEEAATDAAARLELLALEAFAPAAPWRAAVAATDRPAPAVLLRRLMENEDGRCRDILPASVLFRVDLPEGRVVVERAAPTAPLPASAALLDVATRAAQRPGDRGRPAAHVDLSPTLGGRAAITVVQRDAQGRPAAVYGIVVDASALASTLFAAGVLRGIVPLPRGSLRVAAPDGTTLFGALADEARARVTIHPIGALDAMTITAALRGSQLPPSILAIANIDRLWTMGILMIATILVILAAAWTSRREARLAQARSDFVAGVSHDLRMPLAQILLASETLSLRRERDEAARLSLVASIVREARRLKGLVDNVLFVARSGAVDVPPRLSAVRVSDMFMGAAEAVQLAVDDAGQQLVWQKDADFAVLGDADLIRQALVNLIDNAIKYGAAGQEIRLSAALLGLRVRLYVDDEGPGIPKVDRERVFAPYERLARDEGSERTGAGLGLAVVAQAVRACGGAVHFEDGPAGGTRAVIELRAGPPS